MTLVAAVASSKILWYVTRGTGVVALLLLTATVVLGTLSSARWRTARTPRFVVGGLHRNLSLLAIAFVVVHVVTTIADGYAPIGLKDAILPFLSHYRPLWLGFGTVAFDVLLALVATSLLRARLGVRAWRAVHWFAYVSWPIAVLHSLGTGSDGRFGWLALVAFGSCIAVAAAVVLRLSQSSAAPGARLAAATAAILVPVALFVWYRGGPAHTGWAARAGTPTVLLRGRGTPSAPTAVAAPAAATLPPRAFEASLAGRVQQSGVGSNGLVRIEIRAAFRGQVHGRVRITLWGEPSGDGVALAASDVAFAAAGTTEAFVGRVNSLEGNRVGARLANASGNHLDLSVTLRLDQSTGAVRGTLQGQRA